MLKIGRMDWTNPYSANPFELEDRKWTGLLRGFHEFNDQWFPAAGTWPVSHRDRGRWILRPAWDVVCNLACIAEELDCARIRRMQFQHAFVCPQANRQSVRAVHKRKNADNLFSANGRSGWNQTFDHCLSCSRLRRGNWWNFRRRFFGRFGSRNVLRTDLRKYRLGRCEFVQPIATWRIWWSL